MLISIRFASSCKVINTAESKQMFERKLKLKRHIVFNFAHLNFKE